MEDSSRHDLLQIYSNLQRQRGFQIKSVGKKKKKVEKLKTVEHHVI